VSGSWQAERGTTSSRAAARRLPHEDPRAEVGEDVRVGVGPMEFQLKRPILIGRVLCPFRHSVCRSVTSSVGNERAVFCRNDWLDRDVVWGGE